MTLRRFVTLEGGEGSGKSTQVRLLADRIAAAGYEAVATREPGGAPFAEAIRTALLTPRPVAPTHLAQALAFNAARADHLAETIRPALARGAFVVCDRFTDSTRVYQAHAGDLADETLQVLDDIVVGDTRAELTFVLDIDPRVGLARAQSRRGADDVDMYEARALAFHDTLRAGFLAIAQAEQGRCRVVDGGLAPDALADVIWQHVSAHFAL